MNEHIPSSRRIQDLRPTHPYETYLFFEEGFYLDRAVIDVVQMLWVARSNKVCRVTVFDSADGHHIATIALDGESWFNNINEMLVSNRSSYADTPNLMFDIHISEENYSWSIWHLNDDQIGLLAINAPKDWLLSFESVRLNFFMSSDVRNWVKTRQDRALLLRTQLGFQDDSILTHFFSRFG